MNREIDILRHLAEAGCVLVEKDTNRVWSQEEMVESKDFQEQDRVAPAGDVSGPFPGCLQMSGSMDEFTGFPLLGQTRHFFIFAQDPVARL